MIVLIRPIKWDDDPLIANVMRVTSTVKPALAERMRSLLRSERLASERAPFVDQRKRSIDGLCGPERASDSSLTRKRDARYIDRQWDVVPLNRTPEALIASKETVMKTRLYAAGLFSLTLGLVAACSTGTSDSTDQYPPDRITIAVPTDPGSGYDLTARQLAETLDSAGIVDVPITIQNRPGGMANLLTGEMVGRYKGKDDILGVMALTEQILHAEGRLETGLDEFTPLARMITTPVAVMVPADSPYTDLDSLMKAIADKPGDVPIAVGIEDSLIFAQLAQAGGLDASTVNLVTYTGGAGEQATALLTGDVKVAVSTPGEFSSLLESGEVKAIAVVNDERIESLDVPTAVEQGYDVTLTNWRGVYGPADMPDEAVDYWRKALKELSTTDEWAEKAETLDYETAYLDGDELEAFLADTYEQVKAASDGLGTELFPEE